MRNENIFDFIFCSEVCDILKDTVNSISEIYVYINMITEMMTVYSKHVVK